MATRQIPSGSWQARFKLAGVQYERAGFDTEQDAQQWEDEQRAKAVLQGAPTRRQAKGTVAEYAADWLKMYDSPTRSARTLQQHEGNLRRWILPAIGGRRLREVTATDIQRLVDKARADVSVSTAQSVFATASAMFTYARDGDGVIDRSPIRPKAQRPKAQRRTMNILQPAEALQVEMQLPGGWPRDCFVLLTSTGMRWGEMAGLAARGDVDLDTGHVHIRRTVNRHEVGPLKNHKNRTVVLPRRALAVAERLMEHHGNVAPIGNLEVKHPTPLEFRHRWLVQNNAGSFVSNATWRHRYLLDALKAAGITERIRPHDLRHSYVSWMLAAGHPVGKVAQWVGDLPSTVERTYAHLLEGAGAEGADTISQLLG